MTAASFIHTVLAYSALVFLFLILVPVVVEPFRVFGRLLKEKIKNLKLS